MQAKRMLPLFVFLTLPLFLSGCKQVMLEPEVDLRKLGRVALLEFDNLTSDYGISREATTLLAEELSQLSGLDLIEPRFGDSLFSSRAASEGDVGQLARSLGADTLLLGAVTYYFEDVYLEPPRRVLIDKKKEIHRWELRQEINVEVGISLQLVSKERRVLFSRQATGKATRFKTIELPWPGDSKYLPPFTSIPSPDRRQIPTLRREALRDATKKLASNYLPQFTYTW